MEAAGEDGGGTAGSERVPDGGDGSARDVANVGRRHGRRLGTGAADGPVAVAAAAQLVAVARAARLPVALASERLPLVPDAASVGAALHLVADGGGDDRGRRGRLRREQGGRGGSGGGRRGRRRRPRPPLKQHRRPQTQGQGARRVAHQRTPDGLVLHQCANAHTSDLIMFYLQICIYSVINYIRSS